MSIYYHEQLYRSTELMARLREMRVTVCGAGALGGNIAESLAFFLRAETFIAQRAELAQRLRERGLIP